MSAVPDVGIPPIVGLGVVRVQLQLAFVLIQVEHVRVAIAISYVRDTIHATTHAVSLGEGIGLYVSCDRKSPVPRTKYISFLDVRGTLYAKP